jgi:hypothetical protein
MQEKESKTNSHFWISIVKSGFRFGSGYCLFTGNLMGGGVLLIIAEVLGVAEEIF